MHFLVSFFKFLNPCRFTGVRIQLPCTTLLEVVATLTTDQSANSFTGNLDRYNGVTVISRTEPCDIQNFEVKIDNSIKKWREEGRRGIWFKVHLDQSEWVPVLAKKGFRYHHVKGDVVVMYLWLSVRETSNIPPYAHTMVGVGAVVINHKNEILVVSERHYQWGTHWKIPGGHVDPGEYFVNAAIREVREETGVPTEFQSVLAVRQGEWGAFDCSDLYTVVSLKPLTTRIEKGEREIEKCAWMPVEEYLKHPHVHDLNRFFVEKYQEYVKRNLVIGWRTGVHQVLKKAYAVYYVTEVGDKK